MSIMEQGASGGHGAAELKVCVCACVCVYVCIYICICMYIYV